MTHCCPDFKQALQRGDIILVVKRSEFQFPANLNNPDVKVRYCPYCGEKVERVKARKRGKDGY